MNINYLNQDHPVLRYSNRKRIFAIQTLIEQALQISRFFRLEFDPPRLKKVIGEENFLQLLPDFSEQEPRNSHTYAQYEGALNPQKTMILRRVLSPEPEIFPESPMNYIHGTRLLSEKGRTALRTSDHHDSILFDLPVEQMMNVRNAFQQEQIPIEVIEQIDVDLDRLTP